MFSVSRTVEPAIEPISLAEVQEELRIDGADEDRSLRRKIISARMWAEGFTRRSLITQTWALSMGHFPAVFELPFPPLQSVTSIAYVDTAGDSQTVSAGDYDVDTSAVRGLVYPVYGGVWPSARDHPKSVTVTFVAGYGSLESDIPEDIRSAMFLHVGRLYEAREPMVIGTTITDTRADEALLRPYQIGEF